jgi:hypothetical protein
LGATQRAICFTINEIDNARANSSNGEVADVLAMAQ